MEPEKAAPDAADLNQHKLGILFVCTANICRSPTAEVMFRQKAIRNKIADRLLIDSAGTHDYHIGSAPDKQATLSAKERGYDLSGLVARQIGRADLERFDFVVAMDMKNLTVLHRLGEPDLWQKPKLIMSYSKLYKAREVADPYRGPVAGYELALDMLESATDGLLVTIKQVLGN